MSYDDARRQYENAEPPEGRGRPLTREQRAALRVVGAMLDERGVDALWMGRAAGRLSCTVEVGGYQVETRAADLALAVEDALTEVER